MLPAGAGHGSGVCSRAAVAPPAADVVRRVLSGALGAGEWLVSPNEMIVSAVKTATLRWACDAAGTAGRPSVYPAVPHPCFSLLPPCTAPQGLRERNWTSKYYNPAAEKWRLQFFEDRCAALGTRGGCQCIVPRHAGQEAAAALAPSPPSHCCCSFEGHCMLPTLHPLPSMPLQRSLHAPRL